MAVSSARLSGLALWVRNWDLLVALTTRELVLRYRGTILGYAWWVARPLALGLLLWFAMRKVLAVDVPNYSLFIMCGLFPWFWFSSAVSESTGVLVAHTGLIKRVVFSRAILPLSSATGNAAQFLLTLPVLVIFIAIGGVVPKPIWLIGVPFLLILQFLLTVGLGLALSVLNVFFRDIGPLVDVALTMLFYASAVIFPLEKVPDGVRPILLLNPLTSLMEGWRSVLLDESLPGRDIWTAILATLAMLIIGVIAFRALEKHVADAL